MLVVEIFAESFCCRSPVDLASPDVSAALIERDRAIGEETEQLDKRLRMPIATTIKARVASKVTEGMAKKPPPTTLPFRLDYPGFVRCLMGDIGEE